MPAAIPAKKSNVNRERILLQISGGCGCDFVLEVALPETGRLAEKRVRALPVVALYLTAAFRAAANSRTLSKRSRGFLASARSTTSSTSSEIAGTCSRKEGGKSYRCCSRISSQLPRNGHVPHSHS